MHKAVTGGFVITWVAAVEVVGFFESVQRDYRKTTSDTFGGCTRMARKSRKDLQREQDLSKADAKELWHNKKAGKSNKKKQHGKRRGR
jgi:hypothetical protein